LQFEFYFYETPIYITQWFKTHCKIIFWIGHSKRPNRFRLLFSRF